MALKTFWKNVKYYKDKEVGQTCIADADYDFLKKANKLITQAEWNKLSDEQKKKSPYATLLHSELHAEPFVGDLDAKVYIITLNPGIADNEYKNWQNSTLIKLTDNCIKQGTTNYPFYYLDPKLSGTGGAKYWIEKANGQPWFYHKFSDIADLFEKQMGSRTAAIQRIAKNVCDLEFCPYHSVKWAGSKIIKSLPSVQEMVNFIQTVVIPGVISGDKGLIVGRHFSDINKLLSETTFDYNGKKITFDDLDKLFKNNVVFYRDSGSAQQMRLDSKSPAGKLLLKKI